MYNQLADAVEEHLDKEESHEISNEEFKEKINLENAKEALRKASYGELKKGLSEIEYGEAEYEKQTMPDDIIKMSIFVSVNQMYIYQQGKSYPCRRFFQLLVVALAIFVKVVQIFLIYLLWTFGLNIHSASDLSTLDKYTNVLDKIHYESD